MNSLTKIYNFLCEHGHDHKAWVNGYKFLARLRAQNPEIPLLNTRCDAYITEDGKVHFTLDNEKQIVVDGLSETYSSIFNEVLKEQVDMYYDRLNRYSHLQSYEQKKKEWMHKLMADDPEPKSAPDWIEPWLKSNGYSHLIPPYITNSFISPLPA